MMTDRKSLSLDTLSWIMNAMMQLPDQRQDFLRKLQADSFKDAETDYYRFLADLSIHFGPFVALDVGTYRGASAAHLAVNPENRVVTLDINPEAKQLVDQLGLANVQALTMDSLEYASQLRTLLPSGVRIFDVIFLDGHHTFKQVCREYELLRTLVRQDGLILFDDISSTEEMVRMWKTIVDPKVELHRLHWSGFGAVKIDHGVRPDIHQP